jgi:transcriptional regulator with XRE-family HTH domain
MGRAKKPKPKRLAEKLLRIREALRLSQNELIELFDVEERLTQDYISYYERGIREPSLTVLLRYARVVGVCLEILIDDSLDLPVRLPQSPKHHYKA